jgi:hypothetical protein
MKATADLDVGRYLLGFGNMADWKSVYNKLARTYWFPDKQISKGDFVVLYTGKGVASQYSNKSDTTTHTFFAGLPSPEWTDDNSAAVLFELSEWDVRIRVTNAWRPALGDKPIKPPQVVKTPA